MVNSYTHLLWWSMSCGCWEQVSNGNLGHSMHSCIIPFLKLTQSTLLYTHTWDYCTYIEKLAEKNETLTQRAISWQSNQPVWEMIGISMEGCCLRRSIRIWCLEIHFKSEKRLPRMILIYGSRYFVYLLIQGEWILTTNNW